MNSIEPINFSAAEGAYIKAIFYIIEENGTGFATTGKIAETINAKGGSVTEMVQKLGTRDILFYTKYQGVQLTILGMEIAKKLIKRQDIWITFLQEHLNFDKNEALMLSKQLEFIQNEKLIERIALFQPQELSNPINQSKELKIPTLSIVKLSDLKLGQVAKVIGFSSIETLFLEYLERVNIEIDNVLTLVFKDEYDGSLNLKINENNKIIGTKAAENIIVEVIS